MIEHRCSFLAFFLGRRISAVEANNSKNGVFEVSNVFIEDLIADFDVVLDVDTILDKITNKGMKSLTKVELDFLNNQ